MHCFRHADKYAYWSRHSYREFLWSFAESAAYAASPHLFHSSVSSCWVWRLPRQRSRQDWEAKDRQGQPGRVQLQSGLDIVCVCTPQTGSAQCNHEVARGNAGSVVVAQHWLRGAAARQSGLGVHRLAADTQCTSSRLSTYTVQYSSSINVNSVGRSAAVSPVQPSPAPPGPIDRSPLQPPPLPASSSSSPALLTFFTSSSLPDYFIKTLGGSTAACLSAALLDKARTAAGRSGGRSAAAASRRSVGRSVGIDGCLVFGLGYRRPTMSWVEKASSVLWTLVCSSRLHPAAEDVEDCFIIISRCYSSACGAVRYGCSDFVVAVDTFCCQLHMLSNFGWYIVAGLPYSCESIAISHFRFSLLCYWAPWPG